MNAVATRMNAKQLIDFVPDDKIAFVMNYIQSFTTTKKASSSVNFQKKAAYEALLADVQPLNGKPLSINGQEEIADIILDKYESID
ncbi:MAG: hypothetical protein IKQ43_02155 [Treponema sp.]|nr:hypothetical protein [Treponema sp.]